jgi:hypothetical protein
MFLAASIAAFAMSASGQESAPGCHAGAIITATGTFDGSASEEPQFADGQWVFRINNGTPCRVGFIFMKQKPPVTCRAGRPRGKREAALFGATTFIASSVECK